MMAITAKTASSKLILLLFATIAMIGMCLNHAYFVTKAYAQNTWYVGKGVQPNTFYTYQIQDHDTNQGQPFLMTIYFKQFNSTGNYWVAPTFAVSQGKVFNGTLHLSDLDLTPLGSSKVPIEMREIGRAHV